MSRVFAINGSPRMENGNTALMLNSFIEGMKDAGSDVELYYVDKIKIEPCNCGIMYCWSKEPCVCYIKDDMENILEKIKEAEILVLATPVYIPLPGNMQNFINRLCPLIDPSLEFIDNRTRARLREDVKLRKCVLVSTSGWREKENFDTVIRIVEELCKHSKLEFSGAILRPHSFCLRSKGLITKEGEGILNETRKAGYDFIKEGKLNKDTLDKISRALITKEEFINR